LVSLVPYISEGDIIEITGLPDQHPTGNVRLVVEAITEVIEPRAWVFTFTCSAGDPWYVGTVGTNRVESVGTTLAVALDEDDTSFTVVSDDLWVNDDDHPGEFPFEIVAAGEVMEVSSITSGGTWTVTRSVNGVTKSHDA